CRTEQPAPADGGIPGHGGEGQEDPCPKPAGAGQRQADPERDPRIQEGTGYVRFPGSIPAGCVDHTAVGGDGQLLSRKGESVRDRPATDYGGIEREIQSAAGSL